MALNGFGICSLVAQYLTRLMLPLTPLFFTMECKSRLIFSAKRMFPLILFSWKVLVASFLNSFYLNIRGLIIGKKYSVEELVYCNKGEQFPSLICYL